MENKKRLPALSDLHYDIDVAFKNDELKSLLNQPVHKSWVKKHPIVKSEYIPIDKIEFLMDKIFQDWRVEVLREGVMFHSVYVTVRIHYKNPTTGEWSYHDGVGAKSVQVDKDFSASDLAHIKDAAVMMALPSAKSFAIKDACEHLGKLFGRDLNRKDTVEFSGTYNKPSESVKIENL